jgi:AraC-like DNA-binding protein
MQGSRPSLETIRRTLRKLLLDGHATEGALARHYATSTRSLHRMLASDGTSFKRLLDAVRFEVARQLLTGTDMSAAELAVALRYSDASAFSRAFRRWTGSPPGAWRESAGRRVEAEAIE